MNSNIKWVHGFFTVALSLFIIFISIPEYGYARMLLWNLDSKDFEWVGKSGISFSLNDSIHDPDFVLVTSQEKLIEDYKAFAIKYLIKYVSSPKIIESDNVFKNRSNLFYFKDHLHWGFWNHIDPGECLDDNEHFLMGSKRGSLIAIYGVQNTWRCEKYQKSRFENKDEIQHINIATWDIENVEVVLKHMFHMFLIEQGYLIRDVVEYQKIDSVRTLSNKRGNFLTFFEDDTTKSVIPVFDFTRDECTQWGEKPGNICEIYISDHFSINQDNYYVLNVPVRTCSYYDHHGGMSCSSCFWVDESKYKNDCDYEFQVIKLTPEDFNKQHTDCLIANRELTAKEKDEWKSLFNVDVLLYQKNKYPREHLQILHHTSAADSVNAIIDANKLHTRYEKLETSVYDNMDCKYWLIFPGKEEEPPEKFKVPDCCIPENIEYIY